MAKKKKPAPISMKLATSKPKKEVAPPTSEVEPFNAVSPIVEAQMRRAEKNIANLEGQVDTLKKSRVAKIETPAPVVNILPRARIAKVTIKYDGLGFPTELIPQYAEG